MVQPAVAMPAARGSKMGSPLLMACCVAAAVIFHRLSAWGFLDPARFLPHALTGECHFQSADAPH